MTEFIKQCARKDTLTKEDRAGLEKIAETVSKMQVICGYCDYLQDEVCVNPDSDWCADYPPNDCGCKFGKLKNEDGEKND